MGRLAFSDDVKLEEGDEGGTEADRGSSHIRGHPAQPAMTCAGWSPRHFAFADDAAETPLVEAIAAMSSAAPGPLTSSLAPLGCASGGGNGGGSSAAAKAATPAAMGGEEGARLREALNEHYQQVLQRLDRWRSHDERLIEQILGALARGSAAGVVPASSDQKPPARNHVSFSVVEAQAPQKGRVSINSDPGTCSQQTNNSTQSRGKNVEDLVEKEVADFGKAWEAKSYIAMSENTRRRSVAAGAYIQPHNRVQLAIFWIVSHMYFKAFFAMVICLNSVVVGVEVDYVARHGERLQVFYVIQTTCTILFLVELPMRIYAERMEFFTSQDRLWNWFDFFLVLCSLVEVAFDIVNQVSNAELSHNSLSTARIIKILRITRMIRMLRITRMLRSVRALRTMLYSIMSTLKSVIWAMALLLMILFFFGIVLTQAAGDALIELGEFGIEGTTPGSELSMNLRTYWIGVPRSMMTLFQAITGGMEWGLAMDPLEEVHLFWVLVMLFYVIFTYFAVLNVVTGAFCQGAIEGKKYDRDLTVQQLLKHKDADLHRATDLFRNMLNRIDADGSGAISADEFNNHIDDDSVQAVLEMLELNSGDAWALFKLLTGDGDNSDTELGVEDFVSGCMRLKGAARSIDLALLATENRTLGKKLMKFVVDMRFEMDDFRGELTEFKSMLSSTDKQRQPSGSAPVRVRHRLDESMLT